MASDDRLTQLHQMALTLLDEIDGMPLFKNPAGIRELRASRSYVDRFLARAIEEVTSEDLQGKRIRLLAIFLRDCFSLERLVLPTFVEMGFSRRTINCLASEGITETEALITYDANRLVAIRNFGSASLAEIRKKLAKDGLYLKGEEPQQ